MSEEKKKIFLLEFTEELIRNYKPMDFFKLKERIRLEEEKNMPYTPSILHTSKDNKKEIKKLIKEKTKTEQKIKRLEQSDLKITFKNKLPPRAISREPRVIPQPVVLRDTRVLKIPETRLPGRLSYLKPVRTYEKLNLGKIQELISDPNVDVVECLGADKKLFVEGKMGRKPTNITLSPSEINDILTEFSVKSRIPIVEGITKVAVGDLTLTAVISQSEYQFRIKKIKEPKIVPPRPYY
ncbi:hypothetical protein B6U91_01155 [Candidatus Pacearchaeota archaeon ex4484_71]|nr:MAG: hypothetical protein B6U91_01155 [Candidatus Pacearchaeota archaeon ex4484_71]